jgi:mannonate dehydratase
MRIGLGLYRHTLTGNCYDFTRQAGCTHVVVHLASYFNQDSSNPRNNQPNGGHYVAGNADQLWTVKELRTRRGEIEDSGPALAVVESLDPAHWHDIWFDGPQRLQQIEKLKPIIHRVAGMAHTLGLMLAAKGSLEFPRRFGAELSAASPGDE